MFKQETISNAVPVSIVEDISSIRKLISNPFLLINKGESKVLYITLSRDEVR